MLNSLKGMFFEDSGPQPPQEVKPAPGQPQAHRPATGAFQQPPAQTHGVNQDMVEAIRGQTFARNTALTALVKAADDLKDYIPDPTMRLKAAYKTAGGGRRPQDIADAVAIHLNDVNAAEQAFAAALDKKTRDEVGALVQRADAAEHATKSKTDEIERLNARVQELQRELNDTAHTANDLRTEASNKQAEFATSANEFKVAAETVRAELNGHKATILSTLT